MGVNPGRFGAAIRDLVHRSRTSNLSAVSVVEPVPEGLIVVPGSISPTLAVLSPSGRSIRLDVSAPVSPSLSLTYRVQPEPNGPLPRRAIFAGATAYLTDTRRLSRLIPIPDGAITITGPCVTPTPEPSPSPTSTSTAVPTRPGPTSTATPTGTPTPIPTRAPVPVFLPLALREEPCVPEKQRVDAALVIDASTSMVQERTSSGGTKLDAAIDAAREFLGLLRLDAGDQAAIVAFNDGASVLAELTSDRGALDAALDTVSTAEHTCLVCAVDAAANELASDRHNRANTPMLILLTDGKSNPRPASEAVARAAEAKRAGIVIFSIGLGSDLDDAALEAIASQPSYFYRAPTAADLEDIYRQIATTIPCPAEWFWGRR